MADGPPLVLLTRPRPAAARFAADLRKSAAAPVLVAPLVAIEPVGARVASQDYAAVLFTSANAVSRVDAPAGQRAYCVGARTAEVARAAGFAAVSADGDADALIDLVRRDAPGGRLLHVRGVHGRGDVAERLRAAGFAAEEAVTYRQTDLPLSQEARSGLAGAGRIVAPVFSPRLSQRLRDELGDGWPLDVVAISDAAARPWRGGAARIIIASKPSSASILEAVLTALDSDSQS